MMREKLIALSIVKMGDWNEIYRFLRTDQLLDAIDEKTAYEWVQQLGCNILTLLDDAYPEAWRDMPKPPFVIFYKGDIELLKLRTVAVIGGKVMSTNTSNVVRHIMDIIPKDVNVISGFEIGIEVYSMSLSSRRIGIIAAGFDVCQHYRKHKPFGNMNKHDLILSELPPNVKFNMSAYYRSYHLIHELSDRVCVFELPSFDLRLKYLAYLTDIGKEVVVMPDIFKKSTSGGLGLINRGAKLLLRSKDLFNDMIVDIRISN